MTISEATKLPSAQTVTRSFVLLAAIATGVIVTNLFAPQILVGLIGPSLGMTDKPPHQNGTSPSSVVRCMNRV